MSLAKLKDILLDILFPPVCFHCRRHLEKESGKLLCKECLSSIKLNNTLFCPICRARLADNKKICHRDSPYLLATATNYGEPAIQSLIHYFKYKSFEKVAPILGEILIKYLKNLSLSMVTNQRLIVVPIPLHPARERKRGFNQSKLLAEIIASNFNLPLFDFLKRIKNNEPQVNLKDNEKRVKNVLNCFQIKNPNDIAGKNIMLVDDVFTSGATMNEAVKVLKTGGARKIIALVVAKAQ